MSDLTIRFRPKKLEDIVGQLHLTSKDSALYKLVKKRKIPHLLFFGPPGSGKTTLAKVIAKEIGSDFYELDATNLKIDKLRKIIQKYKNSLIKPLIFIDEIHRLSKNQQETLLIPMEKNEALIIGASTENPYFTLTNAIRSRAFLFELKPLDNDSLLSLFKKVQSEMDFNIDKEALDYLITSSNKDARAMLNLLDYALALDEKNITLENLKSLRPVSLKDGVSSKDTHYDLISAFIKSVRGSDIDASLYYLARMIDSGENPEFIARRLVILSSEDIGNANPNALNLAVSAMEAVSKIGFPEASIILSQVTIYLCSSPKSNSSYKAIKKALDYVGKNEKLEILDYLKSKSSCKGRYLYVHDFGGYVKQKYLSKDLKFYESLGIGFEKTLNEWIDKIKGKK